MNSCTLNELLSLLKEKRFDDFSFREDFAVVYADDIEILFELSDSGISDELADLAVKVIESLDRCVMLSHKWLENFREDDGLEDGFEINGMYFGKYGCGHQQHPLEEGFTITFAPINFHPCEFTVKFHKNLHPFAVEEYVV